MARRRRGQGQPVELFPFLAILACVIGVLTLLIAGLSLGALEIDTSGTDFARLTRATADDRARIDDLETRILNASTLDSRVRHARGELRRRETEAEEAENLQIELSNAEARLERAKKKRDELRQALEALLRELAELENKLKGRRLELERKKRVILRGPRSRRGQRSLKPRFVECRALEIVLNPERPESRQIVVTRNRIDFDARFRAMCQYVKATRGAIMILLVRKGAVTTFRAARDRLQSMEVRFGYLPVPSARGMDFRALTSGK